MTENSSFKKQVRDRMLNTSETYMEARKALYKNSSKNDNVYDFILNGVDDTGHTPLTETELRVLDSVDRSRGGLVLYAGLRGSGKTEGLLKAVKRMSYFSWKDTRVVIFNRSDLAGSPSKNNFSFFEGNKFAEDEVVLVDAKSDKWASWLIDSAKRIRPDFVLLNEVGQETCGTQEVDIPVADEPDSAKAALDYVTGEGNIMLSGFSSRTLKETFDRFTSDPEHKVLAVIQQETVVIDGITTVKRVVIPITSQVRTVIRSYHQTKNVDTLYSELDTVLKNR